MSGRSRLPIALTVAGSDSGGGAGIQADLKAFAALGIHGTSVITCLTAQNPRQVLEIEAVPPSMVRLQLEAVFSELRPAAAKTGMLYSRSIIRVVAEWFRRNVRVPLVVDPVMLASSGGRLLQPDAMKLLVEELLPLATLVTPNLDEAQVLLGGTLRTVDDLKAAALEIHLRFGCAALVKGGHLHGSNEAVDIYFDGRQLIQLTAPRIRGVVTHGTGCAYSAAITAGLARGLPLPTAVRQAKKFVTEVIARSQRIGRHFVLNFLTRPGRPSNSVRNSASAGKGNGRRKAPVSPTPNRRKTIRGLINHVSP